MAVRIPNNSKTLNNKVVNDYAFGIKYPYAMTNNTFELAYDNITALKANIRNLLLTKRGERIGQPLFGTKLHNLLFEQQSEEFEQKIFDEIASSISFWIPEVNILEMNVTSNQEQKDRGELEISVTFQASGELFDVSFTATT